MNSTEAQTFTTVKTRTGKESHLVLDDQPTTLCGRYLRARASQMRVSGQATCDRCLASRADM